MQILTILIPLPQKSQSNTRVGEVPNNNQNIVSSAGTTSRVSPEVDVVLLLEQFESFKTKNDHDLVLSSPMEEDHNSV